MIKNKLEICYDSCSFDELSSDEKAVVKHAQEATSNAYAPYSNFRVGAALMLKNGKIIIGANQENSAFPSGLCAERTAVFAAQANYPDQPIIMIAIAAADVNGLRANPVSPCGACRQVIMQMESRYHQEVEVLLAGINNVLRFKTIKDLIPFSFIDDDLLPEKHDYDPQY